MLVGVLVFVRVCSTMFRKFKKVPHTYHTGSDDLNKAGALAKYHGDKVRASYDELSYMRQKTRRQETS